MQSYYNQSVYQKSREELDPALQRIALDDETQTMSAELTRSTESGHNGPQNVKKKKKLVLFEWVLNTCINGIRACVKAPIWRE